MKKENKDKSKRIVHIILSDKFTSGYINYILKEFNNYEHTIIYVKGKYELDLLDEEYKKNIIEIEDKKDILNKEILKVMKESKKIVASGIFGLERYLILLPHKILKKVYMQFWGGDFYTYRKTNFFSKKFLHKVCLHYCIKECGGIINLIPEDYEQLCRIFPNNTKHYVGIMPDDPRKRDSYKKYVFSNKSSNTIIIGNSATMENHHVEVFEMLKHLKNENIKIICPLAYGDKSYAKNVIKMGKQIFKDKFIPITEYMDYDKYVELLSLCKVGIFNNDRQQAMGNISLLLKMGKKVFLRKNTSMWNNYSKFNVILYDVNDLNDIEYNELYKLDENVEKNNYNNMILRDKERYNTWNEILQN